MRPSFPFPSLFALFLIVARVLPANSQRCSVTSTSPSGSFDSRNFTFDAGCQQTALRLSTIGFSAIFIQLNDVVLFTDLTSDCATGIFIENSAGKSHSVCKNYSAFSFTMPGDVVTVRFVPATRFKLTYHAVTNSSLAVESTLALQNVTGFICFYPMASGGWPVTKLLVRLTLISIPDALTLSMTGVISSSEASAILLNTSFCLSSVLRATFNVTSAAPGVSGSFDLPPVWGIATLGVIGATIVCGVFLMAIDVYLRKKARKIKPGVIQLSNGNAGHAVSTT